MSTLDAALPLSASVQLLAARGDYIRGHIDIQAFERRIDQPLRLLEQCARGHHELSHDIEEIDISSMGADHVETICQARCIHCGRIIPLGD